MTSQAIREIAVETGGLRFAALEAGEPGRPLVLCLHGFPDSAWTWRHLLPQLGAQGLHAVAPFLRGYAPTELPIAGFGIAELTDDVLALEEALRGAGRSVVVGHDWGAAAVYAALHRNAELWHCAIAASVPPAGGYSIDAISLTQLRRSWYSYLFQLPDPAVPEQLASQNDLALVDSLWADWSPGYDAAQDIRRAKEALRPPGHLRAAISYYRDAPTGVPAPTDALAAQESLRRLEVPLLYLHGAHDGCIGLDSVELVRPWFPPGTRTIVLEDAGHFVQLEQPQEFNRLVVEFIASAGE
ncbi:MAG TPA: alpha/beta hydrolase [Gaiellaceae bacterium]|nr:alpha/beta hydrolase [Gaiellaceae bacterium]